MCSSTQLLPHCSTRAADAHSSAVQKFAGPTLPSSTGLRLDQSTSCPEGSSHRGCLQHILGASGCQCMASHNLSGPGMCKQSRIMCTWASNAQQHQLYSQPTWRNWHSSVASTWSWQQSKAQRIKSSRGSNAVDSVPVSLVRAALLAAGIRP